MLDCLGRERIMSNKDVWRQKSDDEVFAAVERLNDYNEDGQKIIRAEAQRRRSPRYVQEVDQHIVKQGNESGTHIARGVTKNDGQPQNVVIQDIKMGFGSMVVFMVKWVLASIPALILLLLIVYAVLIVIIGLFGGLLN